METGTPKKSKGGWWVLIILNILSALASGYYAVSACMNPAALLPPGTDAQLPGVGYYAAMYAVRAIPLALIFIGLALRAKPERLTAFLPMLWLTGLVQVGDGFLGLHYNSMLVGGFGAAAVHILSAILLQWRRKWFL